MPPQLLATMKARLRNVIPGDGETVFTLIFHEWWNTVGEPWINEMECYFWLAAEYHIENAIDEWMNSEYEHVCDMFYDHEVDLTWGDPAESHQLNPSETMLMDAWGEVALDRPGTLFTVPVRNAQGFVIAEVVVSAQDLMDPFGVDRDQIKPVVVIADEVTEEDFRSIENDEEVLLNGYLIHAVEKGEFTTIHLTPPQ